VQAPGDVPFNKYRAFKNSVTESDEPERFVDGDLIERFLDLDDDVQAKAVQGLGADVETVKSMVEVLRRMH
jgi:DNA damage-binding protein 1